MASPAILRTEALRCVWPDGTVALDGVALSIRTGEVTALLGGNGAGKSSLLLSFNGILKPRAGRVLLRDEPLDYSSRGLKSLRQEVGIVFQNPDAQLFASSVYEDISFGLCNLGLPEPEARRRVEAAMELVGVAELARKPVHHLSFGQKKRVALAGVLAMEPSVLLLDEPTAGLDPKGADEIMRFIRELQRSSAMTVVVATHDIEMVPLFCDRACVLDRGRVLFEGEVASMFEQRDLVRRAGLRLPRIAHLLEILVSKDGFALPGAAMTIGEARKVLNTLKEDRKGDERRQG
ncbi:ATP-binding cassette domain-containing protein [Chlorobaculum sp. 24CR]|uniref:ATP-binding cassette domain-containing protein n=1 Tax=Chlorobaculum sp. 24CR TaxID=2508878 RepID=UPI00100AE08D|nr:ATP-binding cassette domain-containing protein [Chlorobaculum sp. 24CR]RXK88253.1 ATP-binding cassette domain-containing protein [Chlorobaculum sp. 24CR]